MLCCSAHARSEARRGVYCRRIDVHAQRHPHTESHPPLPRICMHAWRPVRVHTYTRAHTHAHGDKHRGEGTVKAAGRGRETFYVRPRAPRVIPRVLLIDPCDKPSSIISKTESDNNRLERVQQLAANPRICQVY
jgi:hypothetical protein